LFVNNTAKLSNNLSITNYLAVCDIGIADDAQTVSWEWQQSYHCY